MALLQEAFTTLLDTLFPISCLGHECQKKNQWLCDTCLAAIPLRTEQHCPTCLVRITPSGQVCTLCHDTISPALDGIFIASHYRKSLLPHAIHTWKYRFIPDMAVPLAHLLTSALEKSTLPLPDILLPVPLHSRRLRFRGFNQSELLARALSQSLTPGLELPIHTDVLLRTRYTKPQMKTDSREERLLNLKDAFTLTQEKEALITEKYIWLVDDVATTGTTLEECARILKAHGAKSVFGIVLAR